VACCCWPLLLVLLAPPPAPPCLHPYPPLPPRYLRPSIQHFPSGPQQEALGRQAGFAGAVHYPIAFGLMGCLVLTKAA
jgi:hypothetical protein